MKAIFGILFLFAIAVGVDSYNSGKSPRCGFRNLGVIGQFARENILDSARSWTNQVKAEAQTLSARPEVQRAIDDLKMIPARSQATDKSATPGPTHLPKISDVVAAAVGAAEAISPRSKDTDRSSTSKNESLQAILSATPVTSVADAIATLQAMDAVLPDNDGLKWFNYLYIQVSLGVRQLAAQGKFADPLWMERLDVVFANLYFEAVSAELDGRAMPAAWKALFDARSAPGIAPIQFALAGMNAHINRDLPVALFQTAQHDGSFPLRSSNRYKDFKLFNALLEDVKTQVKKQFQTGLLKDIEVPARGLDDAVALRSLMVARDAAWRNGEHLWQLRDAPVLSRQFLRTLDATTGIAGQGLLVGEPILTQRASRR